ncbi:hypothetical protein U1Q18_023964 [Sarracenia purpurea var. burkii]
MGGVCAMGWFLGMGWLCTHVDGFGYGLGLSCWCFFCHAGCYVLMLVVLTVSCLEEAPTENGSWVLLVSSFATNGSCLLPFYANGFEAATAKCMVLMLKAAIAVLLAWYWMPWMVQGWCMMNIKRNNRSGLIDRALGALVAAAKKEKENQKESEDLSFIRKQLLHVENQQSSLLDLMQKFIGNSQNGMNSLETRVQGLEMTLDQISYDVAVTTRMMSNIDDEATTSCKFSGVGILSPKFWRRTVPRLSKLQFSSFRGTPLFSSFRGTPPKVAICNIANRNANSETFTMEDRRFRAQNNGGFIVNSLAEIRSDPNIQDIIKSSNAPFEENDENVLLSLNREIRRRKREEKKREAVVVETDHLAVFVTYSTVALDAKAQKEEKRADTGSVGGGPGDRKLLGDSTGEGQQGRWNEVAQ